MRYYSFVINGDLEKIDEIRKEKECLREYSWGNTLTAVNSYMFQNLRNNMGFLAYRQEADNKIQALMFFDERKETLENAYDYIIEVLGKVFAMKRIQSMPDEITMYEFMECYKEAKRRDFNNNWTRFAELSNLFICEYETNHLKSYHFNFKEKVIQEPKIKQMEIYDEGFTDELLNIESHSNTTTHMVNMVHYVISSRSTEAACDMIERLGYFLAKANRISGRRMEIISEIEPDLYRQDNGIEAIIENNYGGIIVFDLTEQFGRDPVEYQMTCKYIEKLVKKYRNECLFVFTYKVDK